MNDGLKVIKVGILGIQQGFLFKSFKYLEAYFTESGAIVFFPPDSMCEVEKFHILLDESVYIYKIEKATIKTKNRYGFVERNEVLKFSLKVGSKSFRIESNADEDWISAIQNFDFSRVFR